MKPSDGTQLSKPPPPLQADLEPRFESVNERVQRQAWAAWRQALGPGRDCALLDFPEHANVGDSAIWLGERQALKQLGFRVRYVSSLSSFSFAALRRALPRGLVLAHGGGNFGTLWPRHQSHREDVLASLPDYTVVQLPQSLYFGSDGALAETRSVVQAHPDFTLMVRDAASQALAAHRLGARTVLCPDPAFFLARSLVRQAPDVDILVLARTDHEQAVAGLGAALASTGLDVAVADWADEGLTRNQRGALALRRRGQGRLGGTAAFQAALRWQWDRAAGERLARGCRLLSRGRVVVTDRLHGHILCSLLGIRHVVLDNSYGKVSGFVRQWTADHPLCVKAGSAAEAASLCAAWLAAPPAR